MADGDIKRLTYFHGQFLYSKDFTDEQNYQLALFRDHERLMHTPGIAAGLEVTPTSPPSTEVIIAAGTAFDDQGRRIELVRDTVFEPTMSPPPSPDSPVYITIAYHEAMSEDTGDQVTSGEFKGTTRVAEKPVISARGSLPDDPFAEIVLGRFSRDPGGTISSIDVSDRHYAGANVGSVGVTDFSAESITLVGGGGGSVQAALESPSHVRMGGALHVTGDLAVDGTITGPLGANLVNTTQIANLAVTEPKLANGAVTEPKLANSAVSTRTIVDANITEPKLADSAVSGRTIAGAAVTEPKLANGAVTEPKLANGAVVTRTIVDANVTEPKLANSAVSGRTLADAAVTEPKVANGAVTEPKLANGAVSTRTIVDANVTESKLANGAASTRTIVDASVTNPKLAANAVATANILDASITNPKLAANAVATANIVDANITNPKLAANAVATANIVDAAVTVNKIADGAVSYSKLDAGVARRCLVGFVAFNYASGVLSIYNRFNVSGSGVTRGGVGNYTINWTAAVNAYGPFICMAWSGYFVRIVLPSPPPAPGSTTFQTVIQVVDAGGTARDDYVSIMVAS